MRTSNPVVAPVVAPAPGVVVPNVAGGVPGARSEPGAPGDTVAPGTTLLVAGCVAVTSPQWIATVVLPSTSGSLTPAATPAGRINCTLICAVADAPARW